MTLIVLGAEPADSIASTDATTLTCGDGVLDLASGEQCDDGNVLSGDGCDPSCSYEQVGQSCGDGAIAPGEVCDDGNLLNGDACNPTCNFANASNLFAGMPGMPGLVDGAGTVARFGNGLNTMTTDGTYLWMADVANHAIRRITIATGEVLTVAGNGTPGYVDDASGSLARFSAISGVTTDGMTLWISDGTRLRAMSMSPPYAVITVAGSGIGGYMDGTGASASFDSPHGLAYSDSHVYVLEANAATLRQFDPASQQVVTVAGTPFQPGTNDGLGSAARFMSPRNLTAGDAETLYIADTNGSKVRTYNTVTAEVETLAGDGTSGYVDGTGAVVRVHRPRGLAFDGSSVYWVESDQDTIRQMVLATGQVSTMAGSHCGGAPCPGGYLEGVGTDARFNTPSDVLFHFPTRSLFIFDASNSVLRRISADACSPPGPVGATLQLGLATVNDLDWSPVGGATSYNIYRGSLPGLHQQYTHACLESTSLDTHTFDSALPAAGLAYYYLISAWNQCGEGGLGTDSSGASIPNLFPCQCGNGVLQPERGEQCDDGNTASGDGCSAACQVESCGDGVVQPGLGEECDDGNTTSGDGCSATCLVEQEFCGDGVVQPGLMEQCDDGNTIGGDGCSSTCQLEVCGDGVVQPGLGEECDDGNTTSGDGCSATCFVEQEFCGDGVVQPGLMEQCDDGNTIGGDGCSSTCQLEVCGDGVVQPGLGEQCDDGNTTSGDGCSASCVVEFCGDGITQPGIGEQCDDGNTVSGDGCSASCQLEQTACGNGALDLSSGEQCDDGNTIGGDGCDPTCQYETVGAACGNGTLESSLGEECDDANVLNGDACNPTCNFANATGLFAGMPGMPGLADGTGTAARFGNGLNTMATDGTYLWMADAANHAIRRITIATGEVLTVAGNGTPGYVDHADGAQAQFSSPSGIATDGTTLWIADTGNDVLRAMSATPPFPVVTVAGAPGNPYQDGSGAGAGFDDLRGAAYSAGYVYVLDASASTLRRFDPASQQVATVAGTPFVTGTTDGVGPAARFMSPRHLTAGDAGTLYITDTNGRKLRIYNATTSEVQTLAGDGTLGYVDGSGSAVRVHRPRGLTFDGSSVYWIEFDQDTVRQIVLASGEVGTMAGSHCSGGPCPGGYLEGVGTAALFSGPSDVLFHFPSNSLLVFDAGNAVLRRIQ